MKLQALSKEVFHLICSYLKFNDLLSLFSVCKLTNEFLQDNHFWRSLAARLFGGLDGIRIDSSYNMLHVLFSTFRKGNFISFPSVRVLSASSVDRPEEYPNRVLGASMCITSFNTVRFKKIKAANLTHSIYYGAHMQLQGCMCAGGDPCYWSSESSSDGMQCLDYLTVQLAVRTPDFIKSTLADLPRSVGVLCFIGFSVTPYQAFFHPGAPVYAPRECCLQVLARSQLPLDTTPTVLKTVSTLSELTEGVEYQSEFFSIVNLAEQQTFYLQDPVLSTGEVVRIVMRGKHQRQPIVDQEIDVVDEVESSDDFYLCVSNVTVIGQVLEQSPRSGSSISDGSSDSSGGSGGSSSVNGNGNGNIGSCDNDGGSSGGSGGSRGDGGGMGSTSTYTKKAEKGKTDDNIRDEDEKDKDKVNEKDNAIDSSGDHSSPWIGDTGGGGWDLALDEGEIHTIAVDCTRLDAFMGRNY